MLKKIIEKIFSTKPIEKSAGLTKWSNLDSSKNKLKTATQKPFNMYEYLTNDEQQEKAKEEANEIVVFTDVELNKIGWRSHVINQNSPFNDNNLFTMSYRTEWKNCVITPDSPNINEQNKICSSAFKYDDIDMCDYLAKKKGEKLPRLQAYMGKH